MLEKEEIVAYFDKYSDEISRGNFEDLYLDLQAEEEPESLGQITDLLINNDFNPLEFMDTVTVCMFFGSKCKRLKIDNNVTHILDYAFTSSDLEIIELPNSIESIEPDAFTGCWNLKQVKFNGSKDAWIDLNVRLPKGAKVAF